MYRCALFVAAAAATLVGGCASTDTKTDGQQSAESQDDKVYVTGSRIPRKDKSGAASVQSAEGQDAQDTVKNYVSPAGRGGN